MRTKHRFSIKRTSLAHILGIWFILFCYFTPAYFMYHTPFHAVFPLVKYARLAVALFLCMLLFRSAHWKTNKLLLYVCCFFCSLLLSSLQQDLYVLGWINTFASIIGVYAFVFFLGKKYTDSFLYYCFLYFFVFLLINDIVMVVHPDTLMIVKNELGNQHYHFLTSKNTFSMYSFSMLLFGHLCYEKKYIKKPLLWLSILAALYPIVIVKSMTSIICFVFFEASFFLMTNKINRIFNVKSWMYLIIILSALQVIFTYIFEINIIQYIVVNYIGKDPTLSGRTLLYNAAHELIRKHWLLGMGNGKNGYYYYTVAPGYTTGGIMWAHNTSLDLLTQGGIVLFVLFYAIIACAFKYIFKKKKFDNISLIIVCIFTTYTIMGFTERFDFRYDLHMVIAMAAIIRSLKTGRATHAPIRSLKKNELSVGYSEAKQYVK